MTEKNLTDALQNKLWSFAENLITNDETAGLQFSYIDSNNWTPLHWACHYRAPPTLLTLLLSYSPTSTFLHCDDEGITPLVKSITNLPDDERLLMVLSSCPDAAAIPMEDGWTPLHKAVVWRRSATVMQELILCYPEAARTEDVYGDTPLDLFFRDWNGGLRTVIFQGRDGRGRSVDDNGDIILSNLTERQRVVDRMGSQKDVNWVYDVAALLIRTVFYLNDDLPTINDPNYLPYAALLFDKCSWSFFHVLLRWHPDHANEFSFNEDDDGEGHFLLHKAVTAAVAESSWDGNLYRCGVCKTNFDDSPWFQHREKSYNQFCEGCLTEGDEILIGDLNNYHIVQPIPKTTYAIHDLIKTCPKIASFPNDDGRLPLHLAIEKGEGFHRQITSAIYEAATQSLLTPDIKTHLYPFMLAASAMIIDDGGADEETTTISRRRRKRETLPNEEFLFHFSSCFALVIEGSDLFTTFVKRTEIDEVEVTSEDDDDPSSMSCYEIAAAQCAVM